MDLKYNLAGVWPLRDRSQLPITALQVIKDSSEFVILSSIVLVEHSLFFKCTIPDA